MRYQNQLRKKGAHSTLTDQRFHKLNDVGFVWESHRSSWMINFKALRDFKILHSHCNVPNKEKSLSAWCKHQRREYRKYLKGERTRYVWRRKIRIAASSHAEGSFLSVFSLCFSESLPIESQLWILLASIGIREACVEIKDKHTTTYKTFCIFFRISSLQTLALSIYFRSLNLSMHRPNRN